MSRPPLVIDCDTGRDDALTLWLAQKLHLPLTAVVASYGNTTLHQVAENTARVMDIGGLASVPLLVGADRPSRDHRLYRSLVLPRQAKAGNGLCNIDLPRAAQAVPGREEANVLADRLRQLAAQKGPLDYVIIGPATNFFNFLRSWGNDVAQIVRGVTMMGGRLGGFWDQEPTPDFNIACDPFAVHALLTAGVPVRFVPLNATWPIELPLASVEGLQPRTALAQVAQEIMVAHCRSFAPEPIFRFHDPSLLVVDRHPQAFRETRLSIDLDENSPSFGRLSESPSGAAALIYETDAALQASIRQTILETLGF